MNQSLADQLATSALSGGNAGFIEDLYEKFLQDPGSVEPAWAKYFGSLKGDSTGEVAHGEVRQRLRLRQDKPAAASSATDVASAKQGAVSRLIQVYANRGHLIANLDPLGLQERAKPYVLDLEYFGLSEADLDTEFFTDSRNESIPAAHQAQEHPARPEVHLLRDHRRRVRARVGQPTSASGCRTSSSPGACSTASPSRRKRTCSGS